MTEQPPDPIDVLDHLAHDLDRWHADDRVDDGAHGDFLHYVRQLREGLDALLAPSPFPVELPELDELAALAGSSGRVLAAALRDRWRTELLLVRRQGSEWASRAAASRTGRDEDEEEDAEAVPFAVAVMLPVDVLAANLTLINLSAHRQGMSELLSDIRQAVIDHDEDPDEPGSLSARATDFVQGRNLRLGEGGDVALAVRLQADEAAVILAGAWGTETKWTAMPTEEQMDAVDSSPGDVLVARVLRSIRRAEGITPQMERAVTGSSPQQDDEDES